jgi:hypothetical protein
MMHVASLRGSALAWLSDLNREIWTGMGTQAWYGLQGPPGRVRRSVTSEELATVRDLVAAHALPATLHAPKHGGGLGLQIWSAETVAFAELKTRLFVTTSQLPFTEMLAVDDCTLFADGWRVFSALTHTDSNRELLRRYNLPEPPSRESMVY